MALLTRAILCLLSMGVLLSCASTKGLREHFEREESRYHRALQWGDYRGASSWLSDGEAQEFRNFFDEKSEDFELKDWVVIESEYAEEGETHVTSEVQYIDSRSLKVRSLFVHEVWTGPLNWTLQTDLIDVLRKHLGRD